MKMAPEVDPRFGRVPEQELLSPELGFRIAAELCCVSGKILRGLRFSRRDEYIVRRAASGESRGAEAGYGHGL